MRERFALIESTPSRGWRTFVVVALAAVTAGTLIIACSKKSPRPAEAREATDESPPTTAASAPAVTGPVSYERADSAFRQQRYDAAESLFAGFSAAKPQNPWGHYMLALSAWKTGDRVTAEREFRATIALDSSNVKSRLNLSRVLIESGKAPEAIEQIGTVLAIDSGSGSAYRLLGRAHDAMGETDSAIASYRHALVLDDHDVWAMNNLGLVYLELGRFEDALPPFARAIEIDSSVAVFRNNLGLALERLGRYTAAGGEFQAALSLDSTSRKAAVSLQRVTGRSTDSTLAPVDLSALARSFAEQIASWQTTSGKQP